MNDNIFSLSYLNEQQLQAVTYCDGPLQVIAGAGSGKTRVLTYKIAYLLQQNYEPWRILALTFTNKAANEMKERIAQLVGEEKARYLQMGTFHSILARILRYECSHLGFQSNFTIYDENDSRSLIKTIVKEMQLDDKKYKHSAVHAVISKAKNDLIDAHAYAADKLNIERDKRREMPMLFQIFITYQDRCRQANAMDFDDLLLKAYELFSSNEEVRKKYAERFRYILVDEYQDTNVAQQRIVSLLAKENQKVCVVGDDAQSIYAFRGANIDNILDFQQQYPGTRLIRLERNYRSTQNIVNAANSLIRHNEGQIRKNVFSENEVGEKITCFSTPSDQEEAKVICNEIKKIKRETDSLYSDFAVLYRTNAQSRQFEEQMRSMNIPYRVFGGLSFYQRKEIKDIMAYFRLLVNQNDEEAFRRVVNYPARGIGNTSLAKIITIAQQEQLSLFHTAMQLPALASGVNKGTLTKITAFVELINNLSAMAKEMDVFALAKELLTVTGVSQDIYGDNSVEGKARQENVNELMNSISAFVDNKENEQDASLENYMQEVSLISDLDSDMEDNDGQRVMLMTVHGAKGLEFDHVFVAGLDETIFPSLMAETKREMEEERRLLYVAITRARKHCYLSTAARRYRYGKPEMLNPSRFLRDIDPRLMVKIQTAGQQEDKAFFNTSPTRRAFYNSIRHDAAEPWGPDNRPAGGWGGLQNRNPVANQFRADPKPKITGGYSQNLKPINSLHASTDNTVSQDQTTDFSDLSVGCKVMHKRFGMGTLVNVEGRGENAKATVDFVNAGTKQLLLKFARLTKI